MALFAGELNEVAPKRPVDVCVVGTYIFSAFQNGATSGALAPGVKVQGVTVEGYAGHNTHGLRATPATTPTA